MIKNVDKLLMFKGVCEAELDLMCCIYNFDKKYCFFFENQLFFYLFHIMKSFIASLNSLNSLNAIQENIYFLEFQKWNCKYLQ